MIKKIGVMTTGGDAPGMNAVIRSVVRTAIYKHLRVCGIKRGFRGLIDNDIEELTLHSVSGIINRGGTMLKTIRCPEFKEKKNQREAVDHLKVHSIDAVVIIGGNGSLAAGALLYYDWGIPVINIPASIDNDLCYTDYTVGFDTAVNTALDAIDKIRDTASSHDRVFVVEVMGRDSGSIALEVGLGSGAEAVIIPEVKFNADKLCDLLLRGYHRGKRSSIVIVAEGAARGHDVAEIIAAKTELEVRVSVLGYMQRGGAPSALSRTLAGRFGETAVDELLKGRGGRMVGMVGNKVISTDIRTVLKASKSKKINMNDYKLIGILAT